MKHRGERTKLDKNEVAADDEKYRTCLRRQAMEGWRFAKDWAFCSSCIMLFFGLVLLFVMKDVEFPGWRLDCVKATGLVGVLYIVANAFVGYDVFRFEKKTQSKRTETFVRRKFPCRPRKTRN